MGVALGVTAHVAREASFLSPEVSLYSSQQGVGWGAGKNHFLDAMGAMGLESQQVHSPMGSEAGCTGPCLFSPL